MTEHLLNVVLIAKNNTSLSFLRALNSIIHQTYPSIKVLVVDANEPNSMYSLGLQEDLAVFPNAEYIQLEQSFTNTQIRNHVLKIVEGEYIAFMNSYDRWDLVKAFLQIDQLARDLKAGASCSDGVLIDDREAGLPAGPLIENVTFDASKWILDNPARMSSQVIYRLQTLRETGGFNECFETFCDGDMLIRMNKKHKVFLLPVSLCECHITSDDVDYDYKRFRDGQYILDIYRENFLKNKRMTLAFYQQMLYLAGINYLWLSCCVYILLYIIKAPGYSVWLVIKSFIQGIRYVLKWLYRELSLFQADMGIRKHSHFIRTGKLSKIRKKRQHKYEALPEGKTVSFSSARQYNGKKILDFALKHDLKSIVIPKYVTSIRQKTFYGCDHLVSIEIPNTVTEIAAHAFQKCRNLRQITFEEGSRLEKIGPYAFAGCSALEIINLPVSLVEIGKYAFFKCDSLTQLLFSSMNNGKEKVSNVFPATISSISCCAFAGCSRLLDVEFGDNSMLKAVEYGAFMGCYRLQKILLTGRLQTLGSYAFAYCKELETIAIPQVDNMESIGKCAFLFCEALVYFQLPTQIKRINMRTFYGCSSIKFVKVPKKVLAINHQAFAKCTSLSKAVILSGDVAISPTAFDKHTKIQIQEGEDKKLSFGG